MDKSGPVAERSVIVVLGMDRSGTSLCTQILHLLGMELSEDLIWPDPYNGKGYFESNALYECNDGVLRALDSHWDEIRTLRPLSPAWWRLPAARETEQKLSELVRANLERFTGIWGFKDPRTAGLLPLWRRVFRNCGVRPIYVMTVRHPVAVAASLARRHGAQPRAGELLWLERYYQCFSSLGSQIRCVVHYEDWFSNPLEQARRLLAATGLEWPSSELELGETLRGAADGTLAHEDSSRDIEIEAVRDLYQYLRAQNEAPPPEFLKKFEFAMRLARDYATVAADLQGRPLIGAASLLNREAELAQLQAPPETPAVAEEPAEPVEVAPQAPVVEVAAAPAETPLVAEEPAEPVEVAAQASTPEVAEPPVAIEPNEPVPMTPEEQPESACEEPIPAEVEAAQEADVPLLPENAAGSVDSAEFAVAVNIESADSAVAEHVHAANGVG